MLALTTALTACGAGPLAAVKDKASADIPCDAGKVAVKPEKRSYVAEGCGETARYLAFCNVFGLCSEP